MKKKYLIVLLFLIAFRVIPIAAQERNISFNHYTHADGLSNNWVFCVMQDDRGFIWAGTWDGLNQFDGKDFKVYFHDDDNPDSPSGKEIKCLLQNSAGIIWMGTENGVCSLNPLTDKFTSVGIDQEYKNNLSFRTIHTLAEGIPGSTLWAGGNGLFIIDTVHHKQVLVPGDLNEKLFLGTNNVVNHILPDGKRLWLATSHGIILYYPENYSWEKIGFSGHQAKIPGLDFITHLMMGRDGQLWATSWGAGLIRVDTTEKVILEYYLPDGNYTDASHNILNGLAQAPEQYDEALWISAITGGLMAFDISSGTFKGLGAADPESPGHVYREGYGVFSLAGNGLWVASRIGLYNYDQTQHNVRKLVPLPLPENGGGAEYFYQQIIADPADPAGNTCFLTTNNQGLYSYNIVTGKIQILNPLFDGLLPKEQFVSDIFRDPHGIIWVSTLVNGVMAYDPEKDKAEKLQLVSSTGDTVLWINEMLQDTVEPGTIWIGTAKGLLKYDKDLGSGNWITIADGNSLPDDVSVDALALSEKGDLWFIGYDGTRKIEFVGCARHNESEARIITGPFFENEETFLRMTDLAAGAGDSIFISSFHGVHYFNASSPAPALNRFNPDGDGIRGRTEQLQADLKRNIWAMASDDLHMLEFRSRRIYRLAYEVLRKEPKLLLNLNDINGDIMLGSWKYVFLVKNDSNLLSRERLPVYITAIRTGSSFAPCGPFGFTGSRITLPYSDNSFTVEYTAVNFRAGSSNLYAYKMEGLEEEWNFTGNESVSYKLPPGKYSFRLRAANASGLWDETFVFTDIVIRPPFYRTWWFGILVALLFTSVIYITYRYRINQLLKLQKMRDNISRDLHDDIGSSLTNIAIMNELAVQETRRGGDTEKILQRSAEDIHEVISSLSDIVWNVNPEYDDLKYLLARMRRYALDLLDSTEIVCRIEIMDLEEKISMNMEQRRDLYMIFKEGLNNLVKYSGAHKAEVFIGVENQSVRMAIIDDGKGFKPESVLYGNGLKNMRQRTHLWNGIFRIISAPGKGTELHFIIPIKN